MAIKVGDLIGFWTTSDGRTIPVRAVQFGNSPQLYPFSEWKEGGVVRSRNFVLSASQSFTQAEGITDAMINTAFQASREGDAGGFLPPLNFSQPVGWFVKFDEEGREYLVKGTDKDGDGIEDSLVNNTTARSAATGVLGTITSFLTNNIIWIILAVVVLVALYLYNQKPKRKRRR
jgi:hypothetical protein